mgnify:CR=1 FL=1
MQVIFGAPLRRRHVFVCISALSALAAVIAVVANGASAAQKKPSGSPIKFQVNNVSAVPDDTAGVYAAGYAAAKAINKAGGINGHPLQIVTCNTKATVTGTTECARQAIDQKVAADLGTDPFAELAYPLLGKANVPSSLSNPGAAAFQTKTEFPLTGGGFISYLGTPLAAKRAARLEDRRSRSA